MDFPQILALDVTGRPHAWMKWEDAITNKVKGNVVWEAGSEDILARGGISRMTGQRSEVSVSSIITLNGVFKRRNKVPLTNPNLFRRDLYTCAYCGGRFREEKLTRDHILPTSRKGPNTWMNCITACKACNNLKDDMTPEEADMPLLFLPYVPDHSEELILRNKKILDCQLEFLLAHVPEESRLHRL